MKKKYITCIAILTLGLQLLSSCNEEFLEVEPRGRSLEENYYRNQEEAFNGLIAAYDPVGWSDALITKVGAVNSAADDHFAGGGGPNDMSTFQAWDSYSLDAANGPQENLWRKGFSGVFRSNVLLSKLPDVPMDEQLKGRYTAEARFLRAFYYFDLIRFFKSIPLITEPIPTSQIYEVTQVDRSLVFQQIEEDLLAAIESLPATVPVATEGGRATEGAARALLAKVYLQQEKFGEAAQQFAAVNGTPGGSNQFGYELLENFADLWVVSNKYNSESIFEVGHTSLSNWDDWGNIGGTEGNVLNIMMGPRGYSINADHPDADEAPEYVSGWSFNPIRQTLVDAFISNGVYDPRYKHTVSNIDSLAEAGVVNYEEGYNNTGYFVAKFSGRVEDRSTGGGVAELNFPQNMYEIRLADTYLLEAEALVRGGGDAGRALALVNAVRARAGAELLSSLTLEDVLHERRLELAAEGHRWFDLVRTGKAAEALADRGFVEGKHEFLPIPLLELTNTQLEQDPAYK